MKAALTPFPKAKSKPETEKPLVLSPNFQRIMLYVALGLTLVMIWTSWVEFQSTYNGGAGQAQEFGTGHEIDLGPHEFAELVRERPVSAVGHIGLDHRHRPQFL